MWEAIKEIGGILIWIASLIGAVLAIKKWLVGPLKGIQSGMTAMAKSLEMVQEDTADILCDRLNWAHDYHVSKGWCPKADKARLVGMQIRYARMGRNHLVESYAEDILQLPEQPPKDKKQGASAQEG